MNNHLAKYYTNLLFIAVLAFGTVAASFLSSFTEMLALYDAAYRMNIILCGFNGILILAILKGWRCIDREMKRRLNQSPLNQIEKEWLEKNDRFLHLFKSSQPKTKPMRYSKFSRFKIHLLIAIVLFANFISLWLNIYDFGISGA